MGKCTNLTLRSTRTPYMPLRGIPVAKQKGDRFIFRNKCAQKINLPPSYEGVGRRGSVAVFILLRQLILQRIGIVVEISAVRDRGQNPGRNALPLLLGLEV